MRYVMVLNDGEQNGEFEEAKVWADLVDELANACQVIEQYG